ncbi:hypothetical protein LCGC14_1392090 [marine sediment metagenome]|uniref:DUF7192 domain-containing protein n=1 Tax=marine sediment metagenome TaxID=412755 RepID=A0A0F9JZL2_9ZZZZ
MTVIYQPDIVFKDGRQRCVIRRRPIADYAHAVTSGSSPGYYDREWTGCDTNEEFRDLLIKGWPESVRGVEGLEGLTSDQTESLTFVADVGGAFPNVPAYLSSDPMAMYAVRPQLQERVRGLTLVIDGCYSASVNMQAVMTYAHTVMRLVAWLSAERIEVGVYIVNCCALSGPSIYLYVTEVHRQGDVIQPERVAACLHPSFLRRAWHNMLNYEYCKLGLSGSGAGCGNPRTASAVQLRHCLPDADSIVMLPRVGSGNPEKAIKEAINLKLRKGVL